MILSFYDHDTLFAFPIGRLWSDILFAQYPCPLPFHLLNSLQGIKPDKTAVVPEPGRVYRLHP